MPDGPHPSLDGIVMPQAGSSSPQTGTLKWQRILLKLSGEALMGEREFGHDKDAITAVCEELGAVAALGVQIAIVVGGGNIFRGMSDAAAGMDRVTADHMGMLATVINALALQDGFTRAGVGARAVSAVPVGGMCESYTQSTALRYLSEGTVVIFAAGTGNPYFTTDTAAALRAAEMGCDVLLKGTQVDGVYSADPKRDPAAIRYDSLSFTEVLSKQLKVMDATAVSLCRDNDIPILVYANHPAGMLAEILSGGGNYTLIEQER
ncbi:MAG TPA: UMP kinase [Alphaproteobacteria bacterium]|nr:UMP kinase [Alphaproteobacteria bacterium]